MNKLVKLVWKNNEVEKDFELHVYCYGGYVQPTLRYMSQKCNIFSELENRDLDILIMKYGLNYENKIIQISYEAIIYWI